MAATIAFSAPRGLLLAQPWRPPCQLRKRVRPRPLGEHAGRPPPNAGTVTAAAAAEAAGAADQPKRGSRSGGRLAALLTPLSDPVANAKLLALCAASGLTSVATLMHETYLPIYLADELHMSHSGIGNLQAAAQLLSKLTGSASGVLADMTSPAAMIILGTLLSLLSKPMFALSGAVYSALGARACMETISAAKLFDRMSKGLREAPSKALIGELCAQSGDSPAAAFSIRLAAATGGGFLGAAAAAVAFRLTGRRFAPLAALSAVPAGLSLALITFAFGSQALATWGLRADGGIKEGKGAGVGEEAAAGAEAASAAPVVGPIGKARAALAALPRAYWQALLVVSILYLGRFDMAFGILRARQVLDSTQLPLMLPIVALPQLLLSAPAGAAAKRSARARNAVLLLGTAVLVVAHLAFALRPTVAGIVVGAAGIGIHMAMTHGVSLGMLASCIPTTPIPGVGKVSGTAWSLTDLLLGFVLAGSNSLAGALSDLTVKRGLGQVGCFLGGAAACAASMAALLLFSTAGDLWRDDPLCTSCPPTTVA